MIIKNLEQWHEIVCSRENYICRICKKDFSSDYYFQEDNNRRVNQYVCGHHHPHTQKARPDLVLDPSNGVCLCKDCHSAVHKGTATIPEIEFKKLNMEKKTKNVPINIVPDHILPNKKAIIFRANDKLCKRCKKWLAIEATGICLGCDRRGAPTFKKEKTKKA